MQKRNIVTVIVLIVFAIAFIWNVFIDNETENIKKNLAYAKGVVTKTKARKGSWLVFYEFKVGNNVIKDKVVMNLCLKLSYKIEGQSFTVIYNSLKPKQSRILITERSFSRFNLTLPDSLNWTKEVCN